MLDFYILTSEQIRGPRYCQPTIKGSSLNSGKRPLSSTASDVLDTGSYMWKCNIWGNDDFPSSVLGRNLREPHAVRGTRLIVFS